MNHTRNNPVKTNESMLQRVKKGVIKSRLAISNAAEAVQLDQEHNFK